ncbi:TPA: LacI family DNA-binding transcriptional regulator, partial [Vibrio parahaemolyticus]|nr:LacI family DNA-binding transcriptional regulator [Vibrio parahaemolyticus]
MATIKDVAKEAGVSVA